MAGAQIGRRGHSDPARGSIVPHGCAHLLPALPQRPPWPLFAAARMAARRGAALGFRCTVLVGRHRSVVEGDGHSRTARTGKSRHMHAVVATVSVTDREVAREALAGLRLNVVPRAPGFVSAYWLEPIDGIGMSIIIFDDERIRRRGCRLSAPATAGRYARSGLLNPDIAPVRRHGHVVRAGDEARGAGFRRTDRHKQDISDICEAGRAVAEHQHHHAARHRVDLLHRWIGPERIARPPGPQRYTGKRRGALPGNVQDPQLPPPRNSTVPGALPGRQGVPCSIAGATRAAADGEPWAVRCGGRPGPPRVRWKVIQSAMSTAAATPASRRQGLAGPAAPAGRRSGSRPPLMTSAAGSSGTMPTYPRDLGAGFAGVHSPLG